MADKKEEFVVSDRRRFAPEGELRTDVPVTEEEKAVIPPAVPQPTPAAPAKAQTPESAEDQKVEMPEPPTAAEQLEQSVAYKASGKKMDDMLAGASGGKTMPEMTFERLVESFYMSALFQLGAIRQEGEPKNVDIVSARQTNDSLSLIQEKTKGNLSDREQVLLQNVLFELRMAWIEVTNAIASAPKGKAPGAGPIIAKK